MVSVCVITYNSSKTVVETLESIKQQEYKEIELIISDDCSSDNTCFVCQQWLNANSKRFIRSILVTSPINTGISGNLNRAVLASEGEWIKSIAGDDIMLPHCISYYMEAVNSFPNIFVFLSKTKSFSCSSRGDYKVHDVNEDENLIEEFNKYNASEQCKNLLDNGGSILSAPTSFIKKKILEEYPYDDTYRFMEDYPQWVRLTDAGIRLHIFNQVTILYRTADSVSRQRNSYFSSRYIETKEIYFWREKLALLRKYNCEIGYNNTKKLFLLIELIDGLTNNKKTLWNSIKVLFIKLLVKCTNFSM